MSLLFQNEKELPIIPADDEAGQGVVEDGSIPSSKTVASMNMNKALPSIDVKRMPPQEETSRLHELWNEAGISAREHRKRRRGQNLGPRRIPAPISIPKLENTLPTLLVPSADPSTTSTTPPITRARKRRGFFSARPFSETLEVEKKAPNTLEVLRTMAQDRLKKKLRYAKSAPNLGHQTTSMGRAVTLQPAVPTPVEAVPDDKGVSGTHRLTSPEAVHQQEDVDENAIYFTIDPKWRASQCSVQLVPITPVPDSPTSLGRPDSPLLHRHHSLDQLSLVAQRTTRTLLEEEFPGVYPRDEVLHPIDELHAYLEL